jgi:hypothetical protein
MSHRDRWIETASSQNLSDRLFRVRDLDICGVVRKINKRIYEGKLTSLARTLSLLRCWYLSAGCCMCRALVKKTKRFANDKHLQLAAGSSNDF